jgi:HSP20 family protein
MVRWEPFRDLMTLRDAMDRLFEDSYVRTGPRWAAGEATYQLPIDVYTTDEEIVITASVPGVDPEAVEITIEGDTLTIRGEIKGPLENVNYAVQERAYGRFQRSLRLNIRCSRITRGSFEQGVLTLTIPKQEERAQDHQGATK